MSDATSERPAGRRLDGWKLIAEYIKRDLRTAQRWHSLGGLPVHRVRGEARAVFAYSDEIDRWFSENRGIREAGIAQKAIPIETFRGGGRKDQILVETSDSSHQEQSSIHMADAYREWTRLKESNLCIIARLLREAFELDPANARAFAQLVPALIMQGMIGNVSLPTAYLEARTAAEYAFRLEPLSIEVACAQAWLDMAWSREWSIAEHRFERVLEQAPTNLLGIIGRALLHIAHGDSRSASELLYSAWNQHPLSGLSLGLHSWSEYFSGAYAEVLEHISEARQDARFGPIHCAVEALTCLQVLNTTEAIHRIHYMAKEQPGNSVVLGVLAYLWGIDGSDDRARKTLHRLSEPRSHASNTPHYPIALALIGLGDKEGAIQSLVRSYSAGSLWSLGFHLDPALSALSGEMAFRHFVARAYPNLPVQPESVVHPSCKDKQQIDSI